MDGQAGASIEITPEMIEAGAAAIAFLAASHLETCIYSEQQLARAVLESALSSSNS